LHARGQCLAAIGRPDDALIDFDKAVELHPDDAHALVARGEVRTKLGRYKDACADFDEVLQLKPSHVPAYIGRGHARRALGQWSGAVQDYSRALRVRPQDAALFTERGNAYAKLGRYTEAANDFRRAMRIDSAYGRAFQSAAWLMCTCPDARYRDPMLAMELAKRSVELGGKNDYRCLETLAAALANAGYYDEAQQVQQRALDHAPKTALSRTTARLNLFAAGKPYRDGKTRRQ
jgi:tetratricopeptide (TPR) repeat protein